MSPQRHCSIIVFTFPQWSEQCSSCGISKCLERLIWIQISLLVLFSTSNIIPVLPWGEIYCISFSPHHIGPVIRPSSHYLLQNLRVTWLPLVLLLLWLQQSLLELLAGISLTRTNFHEDQFLSQTSVIHELAIIIFCPSAFLTWNHAKLLYVLS